MCCSPPGPPFSKMRGVLSHICRQYERGERIFVFMDTTASQAGWGVAYAASQLSGASSVIYYKNTKSLHWRIPEYQQRVVECGGYLRPMAIRKSPVAFHVIRKEINEKRRYGVPIFLVPDRLQLSETVSETEQELLRTYKSAPELFGGTFVICVGSGTIAAGAVLGLMNCSPKTDIVGVTTCRVRKNRKLRTIYDKIEARLMATQALGAKAKRMELIVSDCEYTDLVEEDAPFPSHPNYDRKAWKWLVEHATDLREPILFWNIGS